MKASAWEELFDSVVGLNFKGPFRLASQVAKRMRTGQVRLNGAPHDFRAPFGGYRCSGNGREFGVFGIEEYLETKLVSMGGL